MIRALHREVIWSQFIVRPLNNQFGFMAVLEVVAIEHASRNAQADHGLYAIVRGGHAQTDPRAKRKTGHNDGQAGIAAAQKFQRVTCIVHLAAPLVIDACTVTHASEVKAQRGHTQRLQGLSYLEYHLIVHRPAAQWMWMAHN